MKHGRSECTRSDVSWLVGRVLWEYPLFDSDEDDNSSSVADLDLSMKRQ